MMTDVTSTRRIFGLETEYGVTCATTGDDRLTADEVERLHALQVRILGQAAKLVRPGGRLIYVTCSMLSRENEASADAFEAAHPEFRPVSIPSPVNGGGGSHRLRLSPASTNTDGFFAALYERAS